MPNPGEQTHRLHKMDDRTAFELMEQLRTAIGIDDPLRVRVLNNFEYTSTQLPEEGFGIGRYLINQMLLGGPLREVGPSVHVGATFQRFSPERPEVIDKDFDYVTLQFGNEAGAWGEHLEKLLKIIEVVTSKGLPVVPVSSDASETLRTLILGQDAAHQRMIADLHESLAEMTKRRKALEEEAARVANEQREAFETAQRELDEQKAALERQSHMATRRKLSTSIKDILLKNKDLEVQRRDRSLLSMGVFLAYVGLGGAGALGTFQSFLSLDALVTPTQRVVQASQEPIPTQSVDAGGVRSDNTINEGLAERQSNTVSATTSFLWFLAVKFLLSSILTVFGFVSAATWLRKHLDNETRITEDRAAFVADVERASWVIEAIHEVKHEAKGELPKEWVDAVTRNLFAPRLAAADLDEGAQALRALIGLAGSAKVGPQGLELEFNKKGTRALGEADN